MPTVEDWLVARTEARRELWAAENASRIGAEVYLPKTLEAERFLQGGVRRREFRVRPLFPSYLFVRPANGQWHALLGTHVFGIIGLVLGSGGHPSRIRDSALNAVRAFESPDGVVILPKEGFFPNQQIRITRGAYTGFCGIVNKMPANERIQVLLDFMGGKVKFLVPLTHLEAAA
jgi:transcription antitermination factor NusG